MKEGITLHLVSSCSRSSDQRYIAEVHACVSAFLSFDAQHHGGMAGAMWPDLMKMCYPEFSGSNWSLPAMLTALVDRCCFNRQVHQGQSSSVSSAPLFQFLEFFAGSANLSRELLRNGLEGAAFDVLFRPEHDALTSSGCRLFADAIVSSAESCLAWFGTKCSSFVTICVAVSQRSSDNLYMGDQSRAFVQQGNSLMVVTAWLYFLARLCGITCILEQPLNSFLPLTPLMSSVLEFCQSAKVLTYLGAFGHETVKPLQLWSSSSAFSSLNRPKPQGLEGSLVTRSDDGSYTGIKDALVASGVYPRAFAAEVASIFQCQVAS